MNGTGIATSESDDRLSIVSIWYWSIKFLVNMKKVSEHTKRGFEVYG